MNSLDEHLEKAKKRAHADYLKAKAKRRAIWFAKTHIFMQQPQEVHWQYILSFGYTIKDFAAMWHVDYHCLREKK